MGHTGHSGHFLASSCSLLDTMSHYTDEPRFTIEQIDLLQRLRRTGMTKHEILHALETLERLDQEHSDKFGRRSSYGGSASSYGNSTSNVPASSSTATASTQTQPSGMSPSPSNSYDTSPQPCTATQNGRDTSERLPTANGKLSPSRYHANSMGQRSYSFEASEEDLDVDDKVEELMRSVLGHAVTHPPPSFLSAPPPRPHVFVLILHLRRMSPSSASCREELG